MENSLSKLKTEYNRVIAREIKAEEYFKDAKIKHIEHYLPEFNNITIQLSGMMREYIKLTGYEMTDIEILQGFKEV